VVPARSVGDGIYEAEVQTNFAATYYVFVAAPSWKLDYSDLEYFSLMALPPPPQVTRNQ
jgi:hypothetical protein